ncbi:MAG: hypothetical protein K5756_05160 [Clostridiales bacterium]|nr:hypothetical protein [Clostridiales bacterium]
MNKRIVNILAAVCAVISLIVAAACSSSNTTSNKTAGAPATEASLKQILENKLAEENPDEKILEMLTDDYDGDGDPEAFAVTSEDTEAYHHPIAGKKVTSGAFWFVSGDTASLLKKRSPAVETKRLDTGKNTYIVFEEYGNDQSKSYIWKVKNGEAEEEKISGKVGGIEFTDNVMTAKLYSDDKIYYEVADESGYYGMAEKTYYFYDTDEGIKEYGGLKISLDDFLKFEGAEEMLDEIEEKDNEVTTLFYRANGLININYQRRSDDEEHICGNSTLKINGKAVEKYRSHEGVYEASATDQAVYPESLPEVS